MAKKKRARVSGKKQTNARKRVYRGIQFQSELEITMYKLLKRSKIPFEYEKQTFQIDNPFISPNPYYNRFMNGKGDFKDRSGTKASQYEGARYTPDFMPPTGEPIVWIIEVKGRVFADFNNTWRLFRKTLLEKGLTDTILFMPRNENDCREVIKIIKEL